jgi:hypothetical protein
MASPTSAPKDENAYKFPLFSPSPLEKGWNEANVISLFPRYFGYDPNNNGYNYHYGKDAHRYTRFKYARDNRAAT